MSDEERLVDPGVRIEIKGEYDADENIPHNRKEITKIVCSPRLNYVATWSDYDRTAYIYHIAERNNHLSHYEDLFDVSVLGEDLLDAELSDLSDSKDIVLRTNRDAVLVNLTSKRRTILKTSNNKAEIIKSTFLTDGDYVMIETDYSITTGYLFSILDGKLKNEFKVPEQDADNIKLDVNGKIFIYNRAVHILMQWDIKTLKLEKQWVLRWNFSPHNLNFVTNESSTLLAIWKYEFIYIYSIETQFIVASGSIDGDIKVCHFLSPGIGERLFVIYYKKYRMHFSLLDPYTLVNPTDARKLINLESNNYSSVELAWPYVIKDNRYFYVFEGELYIRKLAGGNWIEYLWSELGDFNQISVHPLEKKEENLMWALLSKIHNSLVDKSNLDFIKDSDTYRGSSYQWNVEFASDKILLSAKRYDRVNQEWRPVEDSHNTYLFKSEHSHMCKTSEYVIAIQLTEKEDLLIVTRSGIFIWTVDSEDDIQLRHFWKPAHKKSDEKIFFHELTPNYYALVTKKLDYKIQSDSELVKDFRDLFKTGLHGKYIMGELLNSNKTELIEKMLDSLVQFTIEDGEISNIQLLSIVAEYFVQLSQNYPDIINKFLAQVAFFVPGDNPPFEIVEHDSTSKHRQHFGEYINLSSVNPLNRLTLFMRKTVFTRLVLASSKRFLAFFTNTIFQVEEKKSTIKLVFPLPGLTCYPSEYVTLKELLAPQVNSFTEYDKLDLYRWWNGEALLDFKWNTYGRKYYLFIWFIYTIFLVCFVMAVTLSTQMSWSTLRNLFVATIVLGSWHLIFEIRQLFFDKKKYISSPWNYFDLGAFLFPMISALTWLEYGSIPIWLVTISTLLLELKFLFFFRAISSLGIGIYFSMMIGVARKAFSFILILGFILLAFAHSLHLLLRPTGSYSLTIPSTSGDPNDPWNLVTQLYAISPNGTIDETSTFIDPPESNTNMFSTLYTAILAVNAISVTSNNESFLLLKAEILAEIELFYLLPHQRRKPNWFPDFYVVEVRKLKDIIISVQNNKYPDSNSPYISPRLLKLIQMKDKKAEKEKELEDHAQKFKENEERRHKEIEEIRELIMQLSQEIRREK
ncbi:15520_t:CDS:2 [Acaulospora colombiana]|uniref:15520_t:CDS:1 n=1 Tax=Acaulospora colombiana TaxID=27376 RepID=A0ACA9L3S2_9GLOM|nr:15520_t:CDS:2 [Acaulospora colombiana]